MQPNAALRAANLQRAKKAAVTGRQQQPEVCHQGGLSTGAALMLPQPFQKPL